MRDREELDHSSYQGKLSFNPQLGKAWERFMTLAGRKIGYSLYSFPHSLGLIFLLSGLLLKAPYLLRKSSAARQAAPRRAA